MLRPRQSGLALPEQAFARWQQNGDAANFPLLVAAASPRSAVVFQFRLAECGWPLRA